MQYSKDLNKILETAKQSALEAKRPNVCLDFLIDSLASSSSYNLSIPAILSSLGIPPLNFILAAKIVSSDKKESKNPSPRLSPKVKLALSEMEDIAKELNQDICTPEILLLSLLKSENSPKIVSVFFEDPEEKNFVCEHIKNYILDEGETNISFVNGNYDDEEYEEEEREALDPFSDNEIISQFAVNLNQQAEKGEFDGLINYDDTIEELTTVMCRSKKPNAVLVGSAGTGKTGMVSLLAKMIVDGEAPELLQNKVIFSVSLSTMVSGTVYRGQFEERLKNFIEEVKRYDNIILFFDEIHTLIGAGGGGSRDGNDLEASNILKPELARGEISVIGATTISEYNQTIKKDPALDRRFERIMVRPPSKYKMEEIVPKLIEHYGEFHGSKYSDEFVENLIPMCEKYMPNRFYPDKAVDVIDHCGAMAKVEFWKMDPKTKELEEELTELAKNIDTAKALQEGTEEHDLLEKKLKEFNQEIDVWTERVTSGELADVTIDTLRLFFEKRLNLLSKNGIPAKLRDYLLDKIIGQEEPINKFIKNIHTSSYGLQGQNPNGSPTIFAFYGKDGCGKSFLTQCISNFVKREGGDVIFYNGIEFDHPYKINAERYDANSLCQKVSLLGNPVIIIDDFDKVKNNCHSLFAQIFKEGRVQLANGDIADFSNCKFIITAPSSNSGSLGFTEEKKSGNISLDGQLKSFISYSIEISELSKDSLNKVIVSNFDRMKENLFQKGITLSWSKDIVESILNDATKKQNKLNFIKSQIESKISPIIIEQIESGQTRVKI